MAKAVKNNVQNIVVNLCVNLKLSFWDAVKLRLINRALPEIGKGRGLTVDGIKDFNIFLGEVEIINTSNATVGFNVNVRLSLMEWFKKKDTQRMGVWYASDGLRVFKDIDV